MFREECRYILLFLYPIYLMVLSVSADAIFLSSKEMSKQGQIENSLS
jgi:hypothetical protein